MDAYFRQKWSDKRLAFHAKYNIFELRPSIKMLEKIWKPDTFFLNGQDSYLHTITYHNKLFRINTEGDILYSQRLTIKSSCPMYIHKYPMDSQMCPLYIGSCTYPSYKHVLIKGVYICVTIRYTMYVRQYLKFYIKYDQPFFIYRTE